MAVKTRTVVLWYNDNQERLTLAVNPKSMSFSKTQDTKEFRTVSGEAIQVSQGCGLTTVQFSTFLPAERSRFFNGTAPGTALAMLQRWQSSRRPIRLMISGTDMNGLFLLTRLEQTLTEGDEDVGIRLELKESRSVSVRAVSSVSVSTGLESRPDERVTPKTYTVRKGDTLWDIAVRYYGSGVYWRSIAKKNGISNPKKLQIGTVLVL